jgi:transposase
MQNADQLHQMDAITLRLFASQLMSRITEVERDNQLKQLKIDKLSHEMAILKRHRFGARSEQMNFEQGRLFDEAVDADLEALELELAALKSPTPEPKAKPRRAPLPAHLPRRDVHHEPEKTVCGCGCALKRIGEEVSEKLDYTPGTFTVERHIRGKWVCAQCETLIQAPVPAHVIDKGIPTAALLAQVLIAKYLDHLPLYRQERIFGRAGLEIPRSTLAQWVGRCGFSLEPLVDALRRLMLEMGVLHADETTVPMLKPGNGKTHTAYMWTYCTTPYAPLQAVVYDFAEGRSGANVRRFLEGWKGTLVCDDFSGYKALFAKGVTEAGCLVHARRKFYDEWHEHQDPVAEEALTYFKVVYEIERLGQGLDAQNRARLRQARTRPVLDLFHTWLVLQRQKAKDGSGIAAAIDHSLKRWEALTRFVDDGELPPDNNPVENCIRPITLGRSNWMFAGSLRAGERAAAVMSLIQSAKLNDLDPYLYLKDVLERLPTHPASRIEELLPHRWKVTGD